MRHRSRGGEATELPAVADGEEASPSTGTLSTAASVSPNGMAAGATAQALAPPQLHAPQELQPVPLPPVLGERHAALAVAFKQSLQQRQAAWDRLGSLLVALMMMANEAVLIYYVAPAGGRGSPSWLAITCALEAAELALLVLPTALQRWLLPPRAYLRWRTALIVAARTAAISVMGARTQFAWEAIGESYSTTGLSGSVMLMTHSVRLLLTSQLHQLPAGAAVLLQALTVGGVVFRGSDACVTWRPFLHPATIRLFNSVAQRLEDYSAVVWATMPFSPADIHRPWPYMGSLAAAGEQQQQFAASSRSFCLPVLVWVEAMFALCLPLGFQIAVEVLSCQRFLRRHCACFTCASQDSTVSAAVALVLAALYGPVLLWCIITRCWLRMSA